MLNAVLSGYAISLGLILAIGAQNAFLLRQGLRGEHVGTVCAVASLSSAVLIVFGVTGFQQLIAAVPWLTDVLKYFGAAFLLVYGASCLLRARHGDRSLHPSETAAASRVRAVGTLLALTWLNPHVYVDTVLLMGSLSTQYHPYVPAFAAGAVAGSTSFFFALGYGARLLRPAFARPATWRGLEIAIGLLMFALALKLVLM
jgi:L-lysine exporter family protein LysE/ArgO